MKRGKRLTVLQGRFGVEATSVFYGDSCVSELVSDGDSPPRLWTFLCRRRLETTENRRPQPSTSHPNAVENRVSIAVDLVANRTAVAYVSRPCGCTCASAASWAS